MPLSGCGFYLSETSSCLSAEERKEGNVPKPCEAKRDLLVGYLSTLERPKVADWEHKQILAAGMGDGIAVRCAQRIEAIKSLCKTARLKYTEHCGAHHC
jgi:hypothetical protein